MFFANKSLTFALAFVAISCSAFHPLQPRKHTQMKSLFTTTKPASMNGAAVIVSLIGVFGVPLAECLSSHDVAFSEFLVPSAHADVRAQQKRERHLTIY
jgi:hypothetical protein